MNERSKGGKIIKYENMKENCMTKVDIFSGFLGAGKTTLIKKLIKEAYSGEKLVIIENEFGKIGIDSGFLREAGIEITEMNSGCICCSLVGDFGKALGEVMERFSPDRIIIEPSGVGKLSDVIKAVQNADIEGMELNAYVTVIDALKCKMYMKNFEEFYRNQIEFASSVVLSRTAGISDSKLSDCVKTVREINSEATLIVADWDDLDGKTMLEAIEKKNGLEDELKEMLNHHHDEHSCCGHDHHHEHHHEHDKCDDPECSCHDHHHDEHSCCGHEHHHDHHHEHDKCDDPECSCHDHHHDEHSCCGHDHHHEHHHEHDKCDDPECSCHHHDHHADEVFSSWGVETASAYSEAFLSDCLDRLDSGFCGMILRAKGIVRCKDGGWLHFDYVPGEKNIRYGAADVIGKLCVIGAALNKEAIAELFGLDS